MSYLSEEEERKNEQAMFNIMAGTIRQKSTESKNRMFFIITLIIIIVIQFFVIWGQYQYYSGTITTTTTTETVEDNSTIEINSDGEGATAEYIEGNQYNDNSTHNEGGEE